MRFSMKKRLLDAYKLTLCFPPARGYPLTARKTLLAAGKALTSWTAVVTLAVAVVPAQAATINVSGFLAGKNPIIIDSIGYFENVTNAPFPFTGQYVTIADTLIQDGGWGIKVFTSSFVDNLTFTGGNLQEASVQVSLSRMGQLNGVWAISYRTSI